MDSITLYKLMILYMLHKMNSTMSNAQISDFFLNKGYTSYFTVQEVLDDMINENYIRSSSYHNASHYSMTPLGQETLSLLDQKLPFTIKSDINEYIGNNRFDFQSQNSVTADYSTASNGDVITHLKALDGTTVLLDIKIACINEEQAKTFCSKWKDASFDIYSTIYKALS